ncbi:MAG: hypothetical protein ACOZBW_13315 [Thermodesulfobacteriota bacterium]
MAMKTACRFLGLDTEPDSDPDFDNDLDEEKYARQLPASLDLLSESC